VTSFSKSAVFTSVALINNSTKFEISNESQTLVQTQVPGAITLVTTNSKITNVPDNVLTPDNELLRNRLCRQISVQS
jgi:tRNA A37 threonylcarbamoyladenosine synthetase subunit TsaC/SUA5/YrdC